MISAMLFCSCQAAVIRPRRTAPMLCTSSSRTGSESMTPSVCSRKASTIAEARTGPMPRIMPEAR